MLCEKGMTTAKTRNALLVPQSTKQITPTKTQSNTRKSNKHCTNCVITNHNVEICRKKKQQTTVVTTEASQPNQKTQKTFSYACHIYGLNGHKMTNCPKFAEMQKMFHGKFVTIAKVQLVTETKTIIMNVNVVDVNVTIRSKVIEKQVFKDREPRKAKSVIDWEKKEQLKQAMVETIQQIQKTQTQIEGPSTSMEGWDTTQSSMPNTTLVDAHKYQ